HQDLHPFPTRRSSDLRTKWHHTIFMPLRNKNRGSDFFQLRLRLIHQFHKFYISPKRNVTYFCLIMFIHFIFMKFSSKTISNHFRSEEHTSELQSRFDL